MKFNFQGKSIYIDGYLAKNYDFLKAAVRRDFDNVLLGDGLEGGGKSVFFQQGAAYLDPTFNIDRIAFTPWEFERAVKKAGAYEAVLYDEAFTGLSARGFMTDINRSLVSMLTMIRAKNLHVLILSPCFWDIERYVSLWRSRALLNVYVGKQWERGFFAFYNYARKKDLFIKGKKMLSYCVPPNFRGRFTNAYVVDEKEYRERKYKAMVAKQRYGGFEKFKRQRDALVNFCLQEGYTQSEISQGIKGRGVKGIGRSAVSMIAGSPGIQGDDQNL